VRRNSSVGKLVKLFCERVLNHVQQGSELTKQMTEEGEGGGTNTVVRDLSKPMVVGMAVKKLKPRDLLFKSESRKFSRLFRGGKKKEDILTERTAQSSFQYLREVNRRFHKLGD